MDPLIKSQLLCQLSYAPKYLTLFGFFKLELPSKESRKAISTSAGPIKEIKVVYGRVVEERGRFGMIARRALAPFQHLMA